MSELIFTDNFVVEDLGIIEHDVYDIEVENNHNFFGNGICVHNSWYISLGAAVDKAFEGKDVDIQEKVNFCDKFCEQIIGKIFREEAVHLAEYTNAKRNAMSVKRESIADKGIWSIKKRYALNVYDDEGVRYTTPKVKIVGGSAISSSTPPKCKQAIKDILELILTKSEKDVQDYIVKFRQEFFTGTPEEIGSSVGVTSLNYDIGDGKFKLGTPFHCRGAITYNKLITSMNLTHKYSKINEGDKVFVVAIRPKNPVQCTWIAFPDVLPKEFGLHKFVDYDKQFEKSFLAPVESYLNVIGWKAQQINNIDSFFT